jgi:L-rhamnose isomerase
MHCWQGDDVRGFETQSGTSGGGIQATGNHPGRARTPDELRADLEFAYSMIPGKHRLNLHAFYLDTDETPDRDEIEYKHFTPWVDWAKDQGIKLDFNPTFFAHAKADDNLTLSHPDQGIRDFWVEHGHRCREIAAQMGAAQGGEVVNNIWVPDGSKDNPVDRMGARRRLEASLDALFAPKHSAEHLLDAVECKLFGIGVEAMTVGSHEFYMGYAIRNQTALCLDMGHFHPTENVADKLSAVALSVKDILLHVSRPMRWDSDHVILLDDSIRAMAQELVFADLLERTRIGLDFFDATISRTAAWVIGVRNMQKALMEALLAPQAKLKAAEEALDFTTRLAVTEEMKSLPYGAVWKEFCQRSERPDGVALLSELEGYRAKVSARG